jgi:hypothetical protein
MFTPDSRYAATPTEAALDAQGRGVTVVRLRRLPETPGSPETVTAAADRPDLIAERRLRDATRFWRVADANTELDARDLARPIGRVVNVPER